MNDEYTCGMLLYAFSEEHAHNLISTKKYISEIYFILIPFQIIMDVTRTKIKLNILKQALHLETPNFLVTRTQSFPYSFKLATGVNSEKLLMKVEFCIVRLVLELKC